MAYDKDTPQGSEAISDTQPKILGNFQAIDGWTAVDHVGFNLADEGKHNKVTLIAQGGAPAFTNATDLGMWNALGGDSGKQEVYIAKTTNNTRVNVAMTESSISAVDLTSGSSVYTMLPSGMKLFGYTRGGLNATNTVQYEVVDLSPLGLLTRVYSVVITVEEVSTFTATNIVRAWIKGGSITNTGFTIAYVRTGSTNLNFKVRFQLLGY